MDNDNSSGLEFTYSIPEYFEWFPKSRFGAFIHWGPYSLTGRGEQALFRDHMDLEEYQKMACGWNPKNYDARRWARAFKNAGMKYACLTTRHHDGYCLWDTATTNYSSMQKAPGRDFVREFCDAMREEGLRVGLYYSWCDWRVPAYYDGPEKDPDGWADMKNYIHAQVEELCTKYGRIDYFFFDGVWPRCAEDLGTTELVKKMRTWQPEILINNRLGYVTDPKQLLAHGGGNDEGDFGTPERLITPEDRLWESNQVSYWRWWGFHSGERWKTAAEILDRMCTCFTSGGNMLLNVGPDPDGNLPGEYLEILEKIGRWLRLYGEAVYDISGGNLTEALTYGYQSIKGNELYLILRFWDGRKNFRFPDLVSEVEKVTLLGEHARSLEFTKKGDVLEISLPAQPPEEELFSVIRITCKGRPETNYWGSQRLWEGDPERISAWNRDRWEKDKFDVN